MMFILLLVFLMVVPLSAQFSNLTTNYAGTVVYFSSTLKMRDSDENPYPKAFVADANGIRLYDQREREWGPPILSLGFQPVTNPYAVLKVELSGDGRVLAETAHRDCGGGSGCYDESTTETQISGSSADPLTLQGNASLSSNGNFAILCCNTQLAAKTYLVSLETGQQQDLGYLAVPGLSTGRRAVSNDGFAIIHDQGTFMLAGLDSSRVITLGPAFESDKAYDPSKVFGGCTIDDAAQIAVCQVSNLLFSARPTSTYRIDLATGESQMLGPEAWQPAISSDGQTIAYLASDSSGVRQLFVEPAMGPRRQLTNINAGIGTFVLSGNGQVAYVATFSGRLLRIDLETSDVTQVVDRSVTVVAGPGYPVPGSLFHLNGYGFADEAHAGTLPAGSEISGARVLIDGTAVPLLYVTPTEIRFQVPWEIAAGKHTIKVDAAPEAPFEEDGQVVEFKTGFAHFELNRNSFYDAGYPVPLAVHADWSFVTTEHPAKPGEVITLYLSGLGPVDQPQADGYPAPAAPAAQTVQFGKGSCYQVGSYPPDVDDILFSGLAPGLIGLYQVNLQLPSTIPDSGPLYLHCTTAPPGTDGGETVSIPVAP